MGKENLQQCKETYENFKTTMAIDSVHAARIAG